LRAAAELHRELGRFSDATDDAFAAAFALHQRSRRYAEARAVLGAARASAARYAEGLAREPYYSGVLAAETGDRRRARALLRLAKERAEALGVRRVAHNATSALALEMQALGRPRDALATLRELESKRADASACERSELDINLGWCALLTSADDDGPREDARPALTRAAESTDCPDAYLRSFALGNLAREALERGAADEATALLARARAATSEPRGGEHVAWLDLDARIALARGRADAALAKFDAALDYAAAAALDDARWSAEVGRAEALTKLGRADAAIRAFEQAETILDRTSVLAPLGEGRGSFLADRARSARGLVGLLVARQRPDAALEAARRSRRRAVASVARALRVEQLDDDARAAWEGAVRDYRAARAALDLEAKDDWKASREELAAKRERRRTRERELSASLERAAAALGEARVVDAPPADASAARPVPAPSPPGDAAAARRDKSELLLTFHPLPTGWVAIAARDGRARAWTVPAPSEAPARAQAILDPLRPLMDGASRLVVLAYGSYRNVDVHALTVDGAPLLSRLPVVYALDATGASRPSGEGDAVVVADPLGDLPNARAEGDAVAAALAGAMRTRVLKGEQATSARVIAAAQNARALHYAGHGEFVGREGWESSLPLAEGTSLRVTDILALPRAPATLVLSGCEAGKSAGDVELVGLAQAFVLAGARAVVAPTRKVTDALGRDMARGLYDAPDGADASAGAWVIGDPGAALRAAALRVRDAQPTADWAAFRVLVP
ncbi:MAG: CHAT domain-containing protein, partial [Myxococcales bacterium]|nr:CHAT domain-containing protein [Myxococcales bacterium]